MELQEYYQFRYDMYKEFIKNNGGDIKIFEIPFIQEIVMDIIVNGNPRLRSEGRSTLFFKLPNEDGTFDICGRMDGPYVDLCYKMKKYNGYILINKYKYKGIVGVDIDVPYKPKPYITGQAIIIDTKDGSVEMYEDTWKITPSDSSLLLSLKNEGTKESMIIYILIKKIIIYIH